MKKLSLIIPFFLSATGVAAHDESSNLIEETLIENSLIFIFTAILVASILVIVSIFKKEKTDKQKMALFWGIIIPVLLSTTYTAGSTVYLNLASDTQGPVHWHADFEIWKCGEKIDLVDPQGLLNRVGSPVFHEHGDDRMHIEGVVVNLEDVNLHRFFETVGGELSEQRFSLPTNEGLAEARNGELCGQIAGTLQVFLYRVINPSSTQKTGFYYTQEKLVNFVDYIPSPYSQIPPGDCIIIEFDLEKEKTDKICETYKLARTKGDITER